MTLSSLAKSNIDQMLKTIAERHDKTPVDIEAIAKSFGAEIIYGPMLVEGSLEELTPDRYLMKVNSASSKTRQRFTIAHETAHIILKIANRSRMSPSFEESPPKEETLCDRSGEEEICNDISRLLLVPSQAAKQLSDWKSLSIQKIEKYSRDWQVSISALLWRVLTLAPNVGGFAWYNIADKPDDPTEIHMNLRWGVFPKSRATKVPKEVWLYASNHSPIDILGNEERFYWKVKFDVGSLSGYRAIRLKAFGKGNEKKVLVIIYPKEFRPESVLYSKRLRQAILQAKT